MSDNHFRVYQDPGIVDMIKSAVTVQRFRVQGFRVQGFRGSEVQRFRVQRFNLLC
jgi:hypothetical protein